jgi:gamma-glutamyl:cysteine ligase YbdK (ATP-grasp superfamily)
MDASTLALLGTIIAGVVLEIVRRFLLSGDDKRAGRKDLRDEIEELWKRIDEQDKRIGEKDNELSILRGQVVELMFYKQRYTAVALENDRLARQVNAMQEHIVTLERKVLELQKANE